MSDIEKFSQWIRDIVGRKPKDIALYSRAVTHGSFGEEDYQRLEFLGDRVLGLTIASELYRRYSSEPEGKLSQRLNGLVSGKFCGEIARSIGVSNHLLLGKQARDDGARQSAKVLGDVMESLIGAVYLDHDFEAAQQFILKHWNAHISGTSKDAQHPKSALQEWTAANNRKVPEYDLVEKTGPHHDLQFRVRVSVSKVGEAEATASSIQAAQTDAAKLFLEKFA
ncbi:MAG: ribonuclease III [Parasphingorhabdus sp.]